MKRKIIAAVAVTAFALIGATHPHKSKPAFPLTDKVQASSIVKHRVVDADASGPVGYVVGSATLLRHQELQATNERVENPLLAQ